MAKDIEFRLEELEKQVQRFTNLLWVLGTLATIFGLSGAWGLSSLLAARERITGLEAQVRNVDKLLTDSKALAEADFRQSVMKISAEAEASLRQKAASQERTLGNRSVDVTAVTGFSLAVYELMSASQSVIMMSVETNDSPPDVSVLTTSPVVPYGWRTKAFRLNEKQFATWRIMEMPDSPRYLGRLK